MSDGHLRQQIRTHAPAVPGVRCAWHIAFRLNCQQISGFHNAPNAPPPDAVLVGLQFRREPPRTVTPCVPPKSRCDRRCQLIGRSRPLLPGVITAATDAQSLTKINDGKLCRQFRDERISLSYVGRQKMLKAFFKMSRSFSTCLSFDRNCSSS